MEKEIRHGVICDEDIGPAVAVVVAEDHSQAFAIGAIDPRRPAHIRKRAVSVVAIKNISHAIINIRMTIDARVAGVDAVFVVLDAEVDVVRHEQVHVTVVIDIAEGTTCAPELGAGAGLFGNIRKCSVSVVVIQLVGSNARHVKVRPPVIIIVRRTRTHSVAGHDNA